MSSLRIFGKSLDRTWLCLLVALGAAIYYWFQSNIPANSPVFYSTIDFIESYGYPAETHTVLTADGYVLDIHRIPHKKGTNATAGPPVLFQHGFLCTSSIWVYQGPNKDLAFILSEEGYDIWLLNTRGNSYTRLHPSATIAYNDFSFHEMAIYDLPAIIDYVRETTGYDKVSYIGHSMGTTILFAALAVRPEYNQKLNHVSLIAPLTTLQYPLKHPFHRALEDGFLLLGEAGNEYADAFQRVFNRSLLRSTLSRLLLLFSPSEVNDRLQIEFKNFAGKNSTCHISIPIFILCAHNPDGMSHRTLDHYHENLLTGSFRMRNLGKDKNILTYNDTLPPLYNLNNINVPTTAYLGTADEISLSEDFLMSVAAVKEKIKIREYKNFNHFDVIWAPEAIHTLFADLLKSLKDAELFQSRTKAPH